MYIIIRIYINVNMCKYIHMYIFICLHIPENIFRHTNSLQVFKNVLSIAKITSIRKICPLSSAGNNWPVCSIKIVHMRNNISHSVKIVYTKQTCKVCKVIWTFFFPFKTSYSAHASRPGNWGGGVFCLRSRRHATFFLGRNTNSNSLIFEEINTSVYKFIHFVFYLIGDSKDDDVCLIRLKGGSLQNLYMHRCKTYRSGLR
jgi:hypothetical protein